MIKAIIFDMDGVLIDSEPIWRQAEVEVFATVGLKLSFADCTKTMGLRIDEAVAYWHRRQPWATPSLAIIVQQIVQRVGQLMKRQGRILPGVKKSLELIQRKGLPMAVASSSYQVLIETALEALAISAYFSVTHSAENETQGKPHPGVFLTAAEKLGITPSSCLAIEDSPSGAQAALAAGMTVVVVPDPEHAKNPIFKRAQYKLNSMQTLPVLLKNLL